MDSIKKTLGALALSATALTAVPARAETAKLDIQSAWPLTMPASGDNAAFLGETLNVASGGDLDVTVYGRKAGSVLADFRCGAARNA